MVDRLYDLHIVKIMQDKQSYNFVENLRDHLESHSQGDVIVTHCNAGQEYITINQSYHKIVIKFLPWK